MTLRGAFLSLAPLLALSIMAGQEAFSQEDRGNRADIWYLGHAGFAVRTRTHLLVFDYQEMRDGQQTKVRPARPALASGWISPGEIRNSKVRVFVSHSHADHYDPVILGWKETVPDIEYYFGWKAADDPANRYFVGPRTELTSGGLEIATINALPDSR